MPKTVTVATDEELQAEYLTWTPICDLVGQDIKGRRAICTAPMYQWQYPAGVPVRTLIRAERYRESGYMWVRVSWERNGSGDCGFSGYREDRLEPIRIKFIDVASYQPTA